MIPIPRASIPGTRPYVSITRTSRQKPSESTGSSSTADSDGLYKTARKKALSSALAFRLLREGVRDGIAPDPDTELQRKDENDRAGLRQKVCRSLSKQYRDTIDCAGTLTSRDGKWQSRYCRHRWCFLCNGIRTKGLIEKYNPVLQGMPDPYFVTLSFQNVYPEVLPDGIDDMYRIFNSCKKAIRYKGNQFKAIRSLEVTVNRQTGTVHPHLHVLIDGESVAKDLRDLWLERCPKYGRTVHGRGQDVTRANGKSLKELFKYATKGLPKLKDPDVPSSYYAVLDLIFRGLRGRRLLCVYGFKMQDAEGDEVFEDLTSYRVTDEPEGTVAVWMEGIHGWVIDGTGELIGCFEPSDKYQKYLTTVRGFA